MAYVVNHDLIMISGLEEVNPSFTHQIADSMLLRQPA